MSTNSSTKAGAVISPALRQRFQKLYEHASRKVGTGEYDYAIDLLNQCVQGDPGNQIYVQNYLGAIQKKFNNNKRGEKMAGLKLTGLRSQIKKAIGKKDWSAALSAGCEALKTNPWDGPSLLGMAEACENMGFDECQLLYLRSALAGQSDNKDVNKACAIALTKRGLFDQAIACWHRIEQVDPENKEALASIAKLNTDRTKHGGNLTQAKKEVTTEQKTEVELSPEQKLEKLLRENPALLDTYIELADIYEKSGRFDQAEQTLQRGLQVSGNELRFQEKLAVMQLDHQRRRVAVAERRAKENPSDEARDLAQRVKTELNLKEIDYFRARSERYPNEKKHQLDLGMRLKRAGNAAEAMTPLQEAAADPKFGAHANLELGECQQQLKQYAAAMQHFRQAVEQAGTEPTEVAKLALYRAGVLAAGLKQVDEAEKHLRRLADMDPKYRDVAERLDKLAQLRHKG